MSPESILLHAPPCDAHLAPGSLDDSLGRLLARECAAARAAGAREAQESARLDWVQRFDAELERLAAARTLASEELSNDALRFGLEIARVIVCAEIEAGRYALESMVRECLAASGLGRGACVVHLHPIDAAALAKVPFRAGTQIEADPGVERGQVQVTTPHGLLVRDWRDALRTIEERVLGDLR